MKKEKEKDYYDQVYRNGGWKGTYFAKYRDTHYYDAWKVVLSLIGDKTASIFDIGCGPGQFAEMVFDHGIKKYTGLDFSEQAIAMARETNKYNGSRFFAADIFCTQVFDCEFDVYICLEVLEHISNDLGVLEKIPPGKEVVCSVPNFEAEGHLRLFDSVESVVDRYSRVLDISGVVPVEMSRNGNKLFVFNGRKI